MNQPSPSLQPIVEFVSVYLDDDTPIRVANDSVWVGPLGRGNIVLRTTSIDGLDVMEGFACRLLRAVKRAQRRADELAGADRPVHSTVPDITGKDL